MKFSFIADLHLSRYGQDRIDQETMLPERLLSLSKTLDEVGEFCRKENIGTVVIGGDLQHGKSMIYSLAQTILLSFFEKFHDLNFIVIDGNHDLSGRGSNVVSALEPLKYIGNVKWIPFNTTYTDEENSIVYIPYSDNVVEEVKKHTAKILISHFGLSEGVLNSGISVVSNLSLKDLQNRYQLALLGHYHKPQEIITDDISVYYVGSLIQLDWGEKNDEKRFLVVDSDTLEVTSIPTKSYKKFIEFEINSDNKNEVLKIASEERKKGNHVKIVVRDKVDIPEQDFLVVDKSEKDITNRGINRSMSEEDKFKRYLEIREIPSDQHNDYLQVVMQILSKNEELL